MHGFPGLNFTVIVVAKHFVKWRCIIVNFMQIILL